MKYEAPQELAEIQAEAWSLRQLREMYMQFPIGFFRKVVKLSTKATKLEMLFWWKVFKMFPDVHEEKRKGKKIRFDIQTREIEVVEPEEAAE